MKFWNTTNLFSAVFTVVIFALYSPNAEAQIENLNDVYSFYGTGTPYTNYFATNRGLGHLTAPVRSVINPNPKNPASYTALTLTAFDVGVDFDGYQVNGSNTSGNTSDFGISYISLAFPLNEKWGAGFGINPFSKVNYNLNSTSNTNEDIGLERSLFRGSGGMSQIRFGTGYKVKNLSLGANFSYLFGTNENEIFEIYEDLAAPDLNIFNIGDLSPSPAVKKSFSSLLQGFGWDFGAQYQKQLGKARNMWTIGATASLVSNLNSKEYSIWDRGIYQESESATQFSALDDDPIFLTDTISIPITFPSTYTLGFAIADSNQTKWMAGLDLKYSTWANYEKNGIGVPEYQNSFGISIGASITPDRFKLKSFWSRVEYRFGLYYDNGHLNILDNNINQYGLTFGMGIPLSFKTYNKLNLSFDAGQKGTVKSDLISQNYFKATMGMTFNSKWFVKRRYD